MMYTCDEEDLGGVRKFAGGDAKAIVAEKRAEIEAGGGKKPKAQPDTRPRNPNPTRRGQAVFSPGSGTPLGRAFKKFLG